MKRRYKIATAAVLFILAISLSLNIAAAVTQNAEPGSDQDPIVSKSYVDEVVSQLAAKVQLVLEQNDALKSQNTQLTSRIAAQEKALKAIQDAVKSGSTAGNTGGNTGNAGANTGNTGNTGGSATNPPTSSDKCAVNVPVLNVRKQPNTTSAIVVQVVKNETLTIVSKSGDWYKVTTSKGISGYVLGSLVTIKK